MAQIWTEFRTWLRKVFSHWIASAGCAAIAALQLIYGLWRRDWPPIFSWALLLGCFVWASFLTWRDERAAVSTGSRRRILYKVRDLINDTKNDLSGKYDSIGALIKFSDELQIEEDVVWVCGQLKAGGHDHPFGLLELTSNNAMSGRWLNFLQEARASSIDIKRFSSAVSFAAKQWSQKDVYLKGRREYAHWEEAHPRPDGIKLLPNIDAEKPKSAEQTRDEVCTKLARYLHAGNIMLEKCRSLKAVPKVEAEEWARDVGALVHLIAGEVALAKFLDPSGIPAAPNLPFHDERFGFFLEGKAIFDFLYVRCFRLRQLIDDIESGRVVPFAKPFP